MSPSSPDSSATSRRVLLVMRHGKAEAFAQDDHERRLTERGHREALETGHWLAEHDLVPTHALVSSATRTRETWEDVAAGSGTSAQPHFEDAVYSADTEGALEVLHGVPADAEVLVYLGHNPTAASLGHLLDDGTPDAAAFRAMSEGFAPASVAVLEISVPWADLDLATGHLAAFHPGGV